MLIFIWFKCKKNALPFKFKNFIVYQSVIEMYLWLKGSHSICNIYQTKKQWY